MVETKWRKVAGSPLEWAMQVPESPVTWADAKAVAEAMGGRLPTLPELQALIDYTCKDNAERLGIRHGWYWTATEYAPDTGGAWLVYVGNGGVSSNTKTGYYYFWACRGGQSEIGSFDSEKWIEESSAITSGAWESIKAKIDTKPSPSDTDRIIEAIALLSEDSMGYKNTPKRIRALKKGGAG